MVHTVYLANLSQISNSKPIAGRTIAMRAAGHNGSVVQNNYCSGNGEHLLQGCTILKAKEYQYGGNHHVYIQRSQHTLRF